jgi:hypothetical protein
MAGGHDIIAPHVHSGTTIIYHPMTHITLQDDHGADR